MLTGNIILKVLVAKQTEQKMCPCTCEYNFLMTLLTTEVGNSGSERSSAYNDKTIEFRSCKLSAN